MAFSTASASKLISWECRSIFNEKSKGCDLEQLFSVTQCICTTFSKQHHTPHSWRSATSRWWKLIAIHVQPIQRPSTRGNNENRTWWKKRLQNEPLCREARYASSSEPTWSNSFLTTLPVMIFTAARSAADLWEPVCSGAVRQATCWSVLASTAGLAWSKRPGEGKQWKAWILGLVYSE